MIVEFFSKAPAIFIASLSPASEANGHTHEKQTEEDTKQEGAEQEYKGTLYMYVYTSPIPVNERSKSSALRSVAMASTRSVAVSAADNSLPLRCLTVNISAKLHASERFLHLPTILLACHTRDDGY